MRYRFFSGERLGQSEQVLVYERLDRVYRFQTLRVSAFKLPASRLEDVTPEMLDLVGPCVTSAIETAPDETLPIDLYNGPSERRILS